MRKFSTTIISITVIITALALAGCGFSGYFSKLSTVQYNHEVVTTLNSTSEVLENIIFIYDESIPDLVTEESEITPETMVESLETAQLALEDAKKILLLESKDENQQADVRAEFENYLTLGEQYLLKYSELVDYYNTGAYLEDLTLVSQYDTEIYDTYNTFIESNNVLVDILEGYI